MTYDEKLQAIYDSETHGSINWFWDSGFQCEYGHYTNPFYATKTLDTIKEAVDWLYSKHLEMMR